jgi:hypothetical protein
LALLADQASKQRHGIKPDIDHSQSGDSRTCVLCPANLMKESNERQRRSCPRSWCKSWARGALVLAARDAASALGIAAVRWRAPPVKPGTEPGLLPRPI